MSVVAEAKRPETARRESVINVRVSTQVRDLIDDAATVLGKTRTDFIVESARKHAIDVLLDQRLFLLNEEQFDAFSLALNEPPKEIAKLKKLLASKSPWEK